MMREGTGRSAARGARSSRRLRCAALGLLGAALLAPPSALAEVVFVLHRGGRFVYPENSILNFQMSIAGGAQWLETDAWFSSDGVPVLHHDVDLCRTTNIEDFGYDCVIASNNPLGRKPRPGDFTLAELEQLEIGVYLDTDGHSFNFPGTQMPTVEEALLATAGSGVPLLIEVKKPGMAVVFKNIVDAHPQITPDDLVIWARQPFGFQEFHDDFPGVRVITGAWTPEELLDNGEQALQDRAAAGDFGVAVQTISSFDANLVQRVHAHGLRVYSMPAGSGNISVNDQIRRGADYVHTYELFFATYWISTHPCADGVDQDGDGLYDTSGVDFDYDGIDDAGPDPQCIDRFWSSELSQCNDGLDNDLDGATDHPADPDCTSPDDPGEKAECGDGHDNDLDGVWDHPNDADCESLTDNLEGEPPPPPLETVPATGGLWRLALAAALGLSGLKRRGARRPAR